MRERAAAAPARVVIEDVSPQVEEGRYPAKGSVGEPVLVEAACFADGHDSLAALLLCRRPGEQEWVEIPMVALPNDRWRAAFLPGRTGCYTFTVEAWVDGFLTWQRDLAKRVHAGQDIGMELKIGAELVGAAANRAAARADDPQAGVQATELRAMARRLRAGPRARQAAIRWALSEDLLQLCQAHPDRSRATRFERELAVLVDPERARFSSWYECFPRSFGGFAGVEERVLPYAASMGFDVLYLPPVHPIGRTHRKGPNNSTEAAPDDPGSPWAIGAAEGGHLAIHPELGSAEDFRRLVTSARSSGVEVALDIAFQCSPDHPWVAEHPEWFKTRPDGTVQYAENPPKKYQDIYPIWFDSPDWRNLWNALRDVFLHWCDQGVRIFRVDNPHTKPLAFWEWVLPEVKARHPESIFLSEAFTRPHVMYRLAKVGFTQSYTYFAWRQNKAELVGYLTEIASPPVADFFRPSLWPNTPDILTEQLQHGGRATFMHRALLAATLAASWGVYGPAFEQMEHVAVAPGKEEYLDSEKYQLRHWDLDRPDSLRDFVGRLNQIRRENPALQSNRSLRWVDVDSEQLLAYLKTSPDGANAILTVVNLDPHHVAAGMIDLPIHELDIAPGQPFEVHDLIADARYTWRDWRNYVELNPHVTPGHVLKILAPVRPESPPAVAL